MPLRQVYLQRKNGVYFADTGITKDLWKMLLKDPAIFTPRSLDMIEKWYGSPNCEATFQDVQERYPEQYGNKRRSCFNGIIVGLGKRIGKRLKIEVVNNIYLNGKNAYFVIIVDGWYEKAKGGAFVWKLKNELVEALDELNCFQDSPIGEPLETIVPTSGIEGAKKQYYMTRYERSSKNRRAAIRLHGTTCQICGFNFENAYGVLGKDFIEVHHVHPLSSRDEVIEIDPGKDLICLCSNCHSMIHRNPSTVLSPQELKGILEQSQG